MKKALLLSIFLICCIALLVACGNVDTEVVNDAVTIANLKTDVGHAFDNLSIASELAIDSERGVISFTVENEVDEIDISDIKLSSGSFSISNAEGAKIDTLELDEGENGFSFNAINGNITVNYTLKITRKAPAHQHQYGDWSIVTEATCIAEGLKKKVCECGDEVTEVIPQKDHTYGNWEIIADATCRKDGSKKKVCSVCGDTITEVIKSTGHDYGDWDVLLDETCTVDGSRQKVCSKCKDVITESIPAKGHHYGDWILISDATCTIDGSRKKVCDSCGDVFTETINALGHNPIHHDAKAPTCTTVGWNAYDTCSRCDYSTYTELSIIDHTAVTDIAVAPTCTTTGLTEGKHCSACGQTLIAQEIIQTLPHTESIDSAVAPTCTTSGLTEGKHCSVCKTVIVAQTVVQKLGHSYGDYEITLDPTCTTSGTKQKTCSRCGDKVTETISKLGHDLIHHNAQAATYTEVGWYAYDTCARCDYSTYQEIPVLKYQITWENYDGTILATDNLERNNVPVYRGTTPTKQRDSIYEYAFSGWSPVPSAITQDMVFVACFSQTESSQFIIAYDANGGDNAPASQDKTKGTNIVLSNSIPTYEGHVFMGWECPYDGNIYQRNVSFAVDANVVLYAVWGHNCTTCNGAGTTSCQTCSGKGERRYGQACSSCSGTGKQYCLICGLCGYTRYVAATIDGVFNGALSCSRCGSGSGYISKTTQICSSCNGTGGFTKETCSTCKGSGKLTCATCKGAKTIKDSATNYNVSLRDGGSVLSNLSVEFGRGYKFLIPTKSGYTFLGWFDSVDGGVQYTDGAGVCLGVWSTSSGKTLYAHWSINTYSITYQCDDGIDASTLPTTYTVEDADVNLENTVLNHYVVEWKIEDSVITKIDTALASDLIIQANWVREIYTVSYKDYEGTALAEIQVEYESPAIYPNSTPTRVSSDITVYTFLKWVTEQSGSVEAELASIDRDCTIYAFYSESPRRYAINYILNGGTSPQNDTYQHDEAKDLTDAVRAGYIFEGWFTDPGFAEESKITSTIASSYIDYTVYAKWDVGTANYTTQHWQENINDSGYTLFENVVESGTTESTVIAKTKAYSGFSYDSSNVNNKIMDSVIGDGSLVLRRYYKRKTYAVTFDGDGGDLSSGSETQTIKYQADAVAPVYIKAGYHNTWDRSLTITEACTITAVWAPNSNSVIFDGNGATSGEMANQIIETDATSALTQCNYLRSGYTFMGWAATINGEVSFLDQADYTMGTNASYTLYAVWSANTYTLSFSGNQSTSGEMAAQSLKTDQRITLPDNLFARDYYTFIGWALTENGQVAFEDGEKFSMLPDNTTLYAVWQADIYAITYHLDDGMNGDNPNSYTVEDTFSLKNATKTGYSFATWYTDAELHDAIDSVVLGSHGDIDLYATYTINQYTITYIVNGGDSLEPLVQDYNTTFVLGTPVYEGYIFKGWFTDEALTTPCGLTVVPAYDFSVYAKWARTTGDYIVEENDTGYTILGLSEAFDASSEFELVIPSIYDGKSVTEIGELAFAGLTHLRVLTIPSSVTVINNAALYGCSGLEELTIPFVGYSADAIEASASTLFGFIFGSYPFVGASKTTQYYSDNDYAEYYIPESLVNVTVSGGDLYFGAFYGCSNVRVFTLGENIEIIAEKAFYGCTVLDSIAIPNNVMHLGAAAFGGCTSLVGISIPFVGESRKTESDLYQYPFGFIFGESYYKDSIAVVQTYYGASTSNTTSSTYYIPSSLRQVTVLGGILLRGAFSKCSMLTSVFVENKVLNIGDNAFHECNELTSVVISNSVTNIGDRAFYDCKKLISVMIPDSVTNIGEYAFANCTVSIIWSSTPKITTISSYSFGSYKGKHIMIPDSVTNIENNAFSNCTASIIWGKTPTILSIGTQAFSNYAGTSIIIPGSVCSIGENAFSGCSELTSVVVPDSVTDFGQSAFYGCTGLISVYYTGSVAGWCNISGLSYLMGYGASLKHLYIDGTEIKGDLEIPSNVKSVPSAAFRYCSGITSVTIPSSVTNIESGAFYGCYKLVEVYNLSTLSITAGSTSNGYIAYYAKNVYKTTGNSNLSTDENGYIFYADGEELILMGYLGNLTELTIPTTATSIYKYAFCGCSGLTSIIIPSSVKSIGEYAFSACSSLEKMEIPFVGSSKTASSASSSTLFGYLFGTSNYTGSTNVTQHYSYSSTSTYYIPSSLRRVTVTGGKILYGAFSGCSMLTSVTIGDNVTSIGASSFFQCTSLVELAIPFVGSSKKTSSDTYQYPFGYIFGTSSYSGSMGVEQYYVSSATDTTTSSTFYIPSSLRSVSVTGGNILFGAFYNCSMLSSIIIPNSVTSIGKSAFLACTGLVSIVIPDSVTSISSYAFKDCTSLTFIIVPDSVKSMGSYVFRNCRKLTSLTIGSGVTSIPDYAFEQCVSLSSIAFPEDNKLKTIGSYAFSGCSELVSIRIPDTVTSIGSYAFSGCSGLISMAIGSGVTSIPSYAFKGCSSLISLTIPDNVTSIGSYAFSSCSGLISMAIGNGVTSISKYAFEQCVSLSSITFHEDNRLKTIDTYAFSGCRKLVSIRIPDSVTSIGSYAFSNCSGLASIYYTGDIAGWCSISGLNGLMAYGTSSKSLYLNGIELKGHLIIPDELTFIPSYAFSGCSSLTSLTIPSSVTGIGSCAFQNCRELTSIIIPDSVTSIGEKAFINCTNIASVTIGSSVRSIGTDAFQGCYRIVEVYNRSSLSIRKENTTANGWLGSYVTDIYTDEYSSRLFTTEDLFILYTMNNGIALIAYLGTDSSVIIPENVTEIYQYAFYGRRDLTSIIIPASVTSIGVSAFEGCTASIIWSGSPTNSIIASRAFRYYGGASITIPEGVTSIGDSAFYGCPGLTSIMIPESVTSIGASAFSSCTALTSFTIPDSVTSIGISAFSGCSRLTTLSIGSGLMSIGQSAFNGCIGLTSITVAAGNSKYHSSENCLINTSDKRLVVGCGLIPNDGSVTSIGYSAFYGRTGLTSIAIPNSVTSIGDYAFYGCTGLTSIMIPDSVTSIGSYAFRGCTGLTLLEIGSGVTTIGNDAFYGCRELITVTIPEGVTNISSSAFSACYRLVEVYNKSSLSITVGETSNGAVGYYAKNVYTIEGGSKLFTTEDGYLLYTSETEVSLIAYYGSEYALIIPPSVTEINQYAFYNNNNLTSVIIPDSVKSIGESSFQSCRGLISVTIGRNVVSIGRYAFDYCYRLVEVYNKSSLSITKGGWDYGDVGYYAKNVYNIEGGSKLSTTEDGFILYLEGNDISLMGYIGSERDLMLPATLTSIYQYAFHYCTELSSVMISDGVTSIDSYAFFGCTSLSSITIPNSVNSIGSHVFQNCMGLTSIYYQGTRSQWEAINKGSDWDNNTGKYTVYFMDEVVTE